MAETRAEKTESSTGVALDSIGMVCARAAMVAIGVGLAEGAVLSKTIEPSVSGLGFATVGLWFPGAFIAVALMSLLQRLEGRARTTLLATLVVARVAALGFARFSHAVGPLRAAPAEIVGALLLAWGASVVRVEGIFRRPLAVAGVALAVVLQIYGTRWVDSHRAYAGLIAETSFVPRLMLRNVLRRVV